MKLRDKSRDSTSRGRERPEGVYVAPCSYGTQVDSDAAPQDYWIIECSKRPVASATR